MRAKDQNITYTIENVRTATDNLNDLTESVKERPWSLVRIKHPHDDENHGQHDRLRGNAADGSYFGKLRRKSVFISITGGLPIPPKLSLRR
ncbi:MAG: hypothetical protein WBL61_00720 [Bryobacteraceae bacterium]